MLASMAGSHNRELQLFSISEPKDHRTRSLYGGPTELKDRLMELSEWREPITSTWPKELQIAFTLFEKTYDTFDLSSFIYGLAPEKLELLACRLKAPASVLNYLSGIDKKSISGLIDRLTLFVESQIGHLFCNESGKTIS